MILALPLNDPSNEELFANIEKVRAKFKLVRSMRIQVIMKAKIAYKTRLGATGPQVILRNQRWDLSQQVPEH